MDTNALMMMFQMMQAKPVPPESSGQSLAIVGMVIGFLSPIAAAMVLFIQNRATTAKVAEVYHEVNSKAAAMLKKAEDQETKIADLFKQNGTLQELLRQRTNTPPVIVAGAAPLSREDVEAMIHGAKDKTPI